MQLQKTPVLGAGDQFPINRAVARSLAGESDGIEVVLFVQRDGRFEAFGAQVLGNPFELGFVLLYDFLALAYLLKGRSPLLRGEPT